MSEHTKNLASIMLGPRFMSQVRALNPQATKLNLRKTLAFPDNRDRAPEIAQINIDYPSMVTGGPIAGIDSKWYGKPVAVIGAGAAGLCAAYELMRSGLVPVIFETQKESELDSAVRHGGRAHSYDFAATGASPAYGELGCMRFPKSHTTLRTYVDTIFKGDYQYRRAVDNQWPPFIDPLLFDHDGDIPQADWKVAYDTAFYARGIDNRQFYRVNQNTTFAELPEPIRDVSTAFGEFLFGQSGGILNELVQAYANNDLGKINDVWFGLNEAYQDKSIFEVLRDQGWEKVIKGTNDTSRLAIFGELGLGSGGFDAFWGTTFMEILRIKIHEDEVNQDAFVGGSSYMLSPFVTHKTVCADGKTKSLDSLTANHIVSSPVVSMSFENGGGVRIRTESNADGYLFPCTILTVSPPAISSSIAIDELLFSPSVWNGIRNMPLTGSGKTFVAFPQPFWKQSSKKFPGRDAIVTTVTDEALRQVYTFDDYHWGSDSPMGVLMMSYTWGDWAHKMGSLSGVDQVHSAIRMLQEIYADEWRDEWDSNFDDAIQNHAYRTINWSHKRGFAGGYRMADLNRYADQVNMWISGVFPRESNAAVFLAGEAVAWLGLSGWVEGALHTGINSTIGVGNWFKTTASGFTNWNKVVDPGSIAGVSFAPIVGPGEKSSDGSA